MNPEVREILTQLLEAAEDYAAMTCGEFCTHMSGFPSDDCPRNDKRIARAKEVLRESS